MPKLYIPSTIKTLMNLVPFCWADWAVRAVLKNSSILLKYPTFEGGLFIFSWASLYCAQLETIWCSESEKYCDSWIEEIKESFKKGCSLELPVSLCRTVVHATEILIFQPIALQYFSWDFRNVMWLFKSCEKRSKLFVVRMYDGVTRETKWPRLKRTDYC